MYKIYNPVTNTYVKEGIDDNWTKLGKVWSTLDHVKLHLNVVKAYQYTERYWKYTTQGCTVINVLTNEEIPVTLLMNKPENYK